MLDYPLLETVAAVIRTGSFEKAASALHVTPSAVSQRIKQLEEKLGAVLVVRASPCTPTAAGRRLMRHAEAVGLLEDALRADLMLSADKPATLRLAINADSLATWFIEAMAAVDGRLFDLVLDDQDYSAEWLRRGEVSAAVSAASAPIQGCRSRPLGALRYVATASPAFMARWFADGVHAGTLARAPAMTFNAKDQLQLRWIAAQIGQPLSPPTHWLPATQAFIDAALMGVGWGLNPVPLVAGQLAAGQLVELVPGHPLDVPLYWHWSRSVEPALRDVSKAVCETAARHLMAPPSPGRRD